MGAVPELPEIETTLRRLGEAVNGASIRSARTEGINTLKSVDPPLAELAGARITTLWRRGKQIVVESDRDIALLIHLMSAGRLQLYEGPEKVPPRPRGPRRGDRSLRLVVALEDGRELRLREFGSKQSAWVRPLRSSELADQATFGNLGPEAWPDPPDFGPLLDHPRPLHSLLRDQHVIAGIGRSWADEILWSAQLSPFKRGSDLDPGEAARLREATVGRLAAAIDHYESVLTIPIPNKLPMPLEVHGREGDPCPRCGTELKSVHFEDYTIAYCPDCQTGGQVLKDRRLSRVLK